MLDDPEHPTQPRKTNQDTVLSLLYNVMHQTITHYRRRPSTDSPTVAAPHTMWTGQGFVVLLRKEVIQPHLPVRLPCYDFVPIADPTFDGSSHKGLGHRLRVLPTFMT